MARCPTAKTYGVNAPPRDQLCGRMERSITIQTPILAFFWLVAAWVKSRAERPSVSVVNRQLHVQIGCKLGIRNRKDELEASKAKQITN